MATTAYGSTYVSGTDLVANYPSASLLVAQGIDSAGYYIGRGNNTQTGSYTTVLTDAGKVITMSNASANTVTIPANSSVAYVIGTRINILNLGAGACTPTAAAGVTINGTITALATNSSAAVIKTATNTWSYVPFGSGGAATLTSGDVTSTTGSPTITTSGGNTIYLFTGSGTIVLAKAGLATTLVLGAGGGGRGPGGPGGGAGAYLASSSQYLPSGTLTVTVGAGGATNVAGVTSFLGSLAAIGGGGVSTTNYGGSACGGQYGTNNCLAVTGQGNLGGAGGVDSSGNRGHGGGGGAGAVGTARSGENGGAGGAGLANSITGSSLFYAGGGGGGGQGTGAAGGSSIGGTGGSNTASAGTNASPANRGSGGGGGGDAVSGATVGGSGSSGVVIISVTT